MRKIERDMCAAVNTGKTWTNGNTVVSHNDDGDAMVFLYAHHIATVLQDGDVEVNLEVLKKYPTNTTMNRLRALGVEVSRKKGKTILEGKEIS